MIYKFSTVWMRHGHVTEMLEIGCVLKNHIVMLFVQK